MVRTCRREFFVELPFFCFYSNSDATEQSGNFLQQMFSIGINSGVKNISGRKSAKIVQNCKKRHFEQLHRREYRF